MKHQNNLWQLNKEAHDKISLVYDRKHTEIYNDIEQNRLNKTIEKILTVLKPQDNINVLDFGSGTGNLTLKFLSFNCIEWNQIIKLLKENHFELIVNNDFLLFNPNASVDMYKQYRDKCSDTKYIIARKIQ